MAADFRIQILDLRFTIPLLLGALCILCGPAHALGEIRIVSPSDTPGANYIDATIGVGETATVEIWVQADTNFNGFSSYFTYQGQGIRLRETSDGTDSFPPGTVDTQANEDHVSFGDVLRNHGSWTGAATDTFQYASLSNADSVTGSYRAAILSFTGETTGIWAINFVFDSATNKVTAVAKANGNGTDIMSSNDSGVIRVIVADTPVIQTLAFSSDTAARFSDGAPFDTTPAGDTVWFAAETQAVTMTLTMVTAAPESIHVTAIFDSGVQTDTTDSFRAVFHIRPSHASGDTVAVVTAYSAAGRADSLQIRFRPDTVAPDTVVRISPINGAIAPTPTFTWSSSSDSHSGVGSYRVQVSDSTTFANIVADTTTTHPDTDLTITTLTAGTFYWRVLSYDRVGNVTASGLGSDSFQTSVDTSGPNVWYLNDTSAVGDAFTTQLGTDTASGTLPSAPKRTFAAIRSLLTIGDTVYFDAGQYNDTITIDTNNIALIGKDSASSIIDPPGDSLSLIRRGIFADTQTGLFIQDLAVQDAYYGIHFLNVDLSSITRVKLNANNQGGLVLDQRSDTNVLTSNEFRGNAGSGMLIRGASAGNSITTNLLSQNGTSGLTLEAATGNLVNGNRADTNTGYGMLLMSAANSNTISNNSMSGNINSGILLLSASNLNRISGNTVDANRNLGLYVDASSNNTIDSNRFTRSDTGVLIVFGSAGNLIVGNLIGSDTTGIHFYAASNNTVSQNEVSSNLRYQIYFESTSVTDTFAKNNILPSTTNPDSAVFNSTASNFSMLRNWWGTIDTSVIRQRIVGSATYTPFRLGTVDTTSGVDTVAPRAPDTVAAVALDSTSIRVTWSVVSSQEEASGFALGLSLYRVYRSPTSDTSLWVLRTTVPIGTLSYNDTGNQADRTYFYRLTATDSTTPVENQSFFSDSIPGATTFESAPPSAFTLLSPVQGAETNVALLRFQWSAATDTSQVSYRLIVDTDMAGSFVIDTTVADTEELVAISMNDTYLWRVIATDTASNSRTVGDSQFVYDTTPPTLPVQNAPAALTDTNLTAITFTWTNGSDTQSGIMEHRVQIDTSGAFVNLLVDSTGGTHTLPANDTYFWRVLVRDDAQNTTVTAARKIIVDTTVPTAPIPLTPANPTETNSTAFTFTWTNGLDTQSGIKEHRLQIDTYGTFLNYTVDSTGSTHTLAANDTYYWRVVAVDSATNQRPSSTSTLRIDTAAPASFTLLSPTQGHETNVTTIRFQWSTSGDSSATLTYRLLVDTDMAGGSLVDTIVTDLEEIAVLPANDTYLWRVTASDSAGNSRVVGDSQFVVDTAAPTAPVAAFPSTNAETNAAVVGFDWSTSTDTVSGLAAYRLQLDTNGTFPASLAVDSDISAATSDTRLSLADGTYFWRVAARDDAGNTTAYTAGIRFVVDRTAPVITSVTIVSSASGYFSDSGGIDTTIPVDTVFFNNGGAGAGQNDTVTVNVNGGETVSFPVRFGEGLDDSLPFGFTYSIEAGLGDTTMTIIARDTAGNEDSVTIDWKRDTVPPPIVGQINPTDSQTLGDTTPTLSWSAAVDTGAGTRQYIVQVATSNAFSVIIDSAITSAPSFTTTGLADSPYYWRVIPYDTVSNADTAAAVIRAFIIDSGVPSITAITIVSSAPTHFYDDTPVVPGLTPDTVYYNPTDTGASQVDTLTIYVSDSNETTVVSSNVFIALSNADTGLNRDTYTLIYRIPQDSQSATITIVATDAIGYQDTVLVRFEMDTAGPTAPALSSPADLHETTATTITYSWTASTDTAAGLAGYRFQIDTSPLFLAPFDSATGLATSATITRNANDTYYWRVIATDRVANTTTVTPRMVVIDTRAPNAGALSFPADAAETNLTNILFTWSAATDTGSGFFEYRVQIDTSAAFSAPFDSSVGVATSVTVARNPNDTYFWRVIAVDDAGNTVAYTARSFLIDTAVPVAPTLTAPSAGLETNSASFTFSWVAGSDTLSGVNQHRLQIDTAGAFVSLIVDSTGATHALSANDTYFWRVLVVDDAGNTNAVAARLLVVDTALPTAVTLSAPAANHDTNVSSITFSWSASTDTGSGIALYRLQIDTANTFVSGIDSATPALFGTRTFTTQDTYYWRVISVDDAGNTNAVTSRIFRVDSSAPTVGALTAPAINFDTKSTAITFTWTAATETGAGLSTYRFQIDTSNTFASLFIDTPTLSLSQSVVFGRNDTYFWRVVAVDSATNSAAYPSQRLRIDTVPPTAAVLIAKNGASFSTAVTLSWAASVDTFVGLATYLVQVDTSGLFTTPLESVVLAAGDTDHISGLVAIDTYFWRVISFDSAGNTETSTPTVDSYRIAISDTTGPGVFTLTSPANLTETSLTSILLRWSDAVDDTSPPVRYRAQADTSGTFVSLVYDSTSILDTFVFAALPANDTYFWRVIATDNSGNTTTVAAQRIVVDTRAPNAGVLSLPANPTDTALTTITFSWTAATDTGTGISGYRLQIDTAVTFVDSFTTATSASRTLPANDTYIWRVIAVDDAGNTVAYSAFTLRVDTRPPTAGTLTEPAAPTDTSVTAITFTWTAASDTGTGLLNYRLQIDTSNTFGVLLVDSTTPLLTGARTLAANDTYYWRVVAVDNAGNTVAYAPARILRIDTTAPAAPASVTPLDLRDTRETVVAFTWTAAAGAVSYRLQIDTANTFAMPFIDSSTTAVTLTETLPANDTYFWRVVAIDSATNQTANASRRIRVDTAPPTQVTLTTSAGDSRIAPFSFVWSLATDSVTSVRSYLVQVDTAGTFAALAESVTLAHPDTDHLSILTLVDTYFWRVLAYDTVGNASVSATDSFVIRSGDTVPPSAFALTAPANRAISNTTVITFRWANSLDDTSPPVRYNLQVDTSGAFTSLAVDTSWMIDTFATVTLAANDTYFWRVISRDNSLNTTVSTSLYRFYVDTRPPTMPVLATKGGASVLAPVYLAWSASADSISGVNAYGVQVSTSAVFATFVESFTLAQNDTDHWTGILAANTYYWRVIAFDTAGNSSLSSPIVDSFRITVADTKPPIFFSASASPSTVSNAAPTAVTFTVTVADSVYVAGVSIDLSPIGKANPTALTPNTAVPSSDTKWTVSTTFETTVVGGIYNLVVTAIDASSNTSTTTVSVTVTDNSPSTTDIISMPVANLSAGGTALSIVSTYGDSYSKVQYEYRTVAPLSAWMICTAATGTLNPDTVAPFWGFFWSIGSLSGVYDVRAVGTKSGVVDPSPGFIRMTINQTDSKVHEYTDTSGRHVRRQEVRADTNSLVLIADGTSLSIPTGSVETTVWVRIIINESAPLNAPISSNLIVVGSGIFREFTRQDGGRTFSGPVTITLPYPDTDPLDNAVGSLPYKEKDLAIYRFDEVLKVWIKEPTSRVNPETNTVSATVNHFTQFAVFFTGPGATNLQNVVIYPNPFVPYDGNDANGKPYNSADVTSGIIFDSMPEQVTVEVFNSAGRRVASFSKSTGGPRAHWDAHTDDNRELASGMYIAIIRSSSGEQIIRKIMIIR